MLTPIFVFGIFASLFLIASFLDNYRHKYILVVLNVVFLIFSYITIANLLGTPKPLDYNIPLYTHHIWKDYKVSIEYGFVSDDHSKIYLLLDENPVRLYVMNYNQKFIDELNDAMNKNGGIMKGLKFLENGSYYGDGDTAPHVETAEPQSNEYIPKSETQKPQDSVDNYNVQ